MNGFYRRLAPIVLLAALVALSGCSRKTRAARALEAGNRDFAAGKYDEAEIEYKDARVLDPLNPVTIGQLGRLYAKEGRIAPAYTFLKKATELTPNSVPIELAFGQICFLFHQQTNALAIAQRILNYQPTNEEALILLMNTAPGGAELERQLKTIPHLDQNPAYQVALGTAAVRQGHLDSAENDFRLALAANPKSSDAYFGIAELRARQNNTKAAIEALKQAANLAPLRSNLRVKYIDFLVRNNDLEAARKALHDLTTGAPDYIPGWVGLMTMAMSEKKYEDAAKYADTIVSRDPENYDGLLGRGNIRLAMGQPDNAIIQFEHLASVYPKMPEARYELANAYLLAHNEPKCVENLRAAVALAPNFIPANLLLAQIEIKDGDATGAIELLTRLLQKGANVPAQASLLLADAYAVKGQYDAALAVYAELAKALPKNPRFPLLMGAIYVQQRKYSSARSEFEKALSLAPNETDVAQQLVDLDLLEHNNRDAAAVAQDQILRNPKSAAPLELAAKVAVADNNFPLAENDLMKAIKVDQNATTAYISLAQIYVHDGNDQKALEFLNGLVSRTNEPGAYIEIGVIHEHMKQYKEAAAAYQKVLDLAPTSGRALNSLAYVDSVYLDKVDQAFELAEKARDLAPSNPSVADTLGWIYYLKGDYTHAAALLEESVEKLPDSAEIQYHVGMVNYMMDKEDAARAALQKAVASPKDYPGKAIAAKRLAILNINGTSSDPAALKELEDALDQNGDDPVVLNRIAVMEERAGQWEKAAKNYETALKKNPGSVPTMGKLAWLYTYQLNNPERALTLAKEAHRLSINDPEVSGVLGHLLFHAHEYQRALDLLANSAEQLPSRPDILHDLAWAYYSVGRVADARATMQKTMQSGPTRNDLADGTRFLSMCDAYNNSAAATAALGQAREMLQNDPQYVPALMVTGVASDAAGDFQGAQKAYEQVLLIYPLFSPAQRQLAILDSRHFPDDAKAFAIAEKARVAYPEDPELGASLGILSFYQSKYSRSAELLQESVANGGNDGQIYYYLGMDYFQLKRNTESKQTLERALALNIPDKMAADARKTLASLK
jgi:tetratricopeptide (TPR) repeat protein